MYQSQGFGFLLGILVFIPGLILLMYLNSRRLQQVRSIVLPDALLQEYVRWGQLGKGITLLKMGVLALYADSIALMDRDGNEVFRFPLSKATIGYTSTRFGINLSSGDAKYDIRFDYGTIPGVFTTADKYELWANKIAELGGKNFITDQNPIAAVIFSPSFDRFSTGIILGILVIVTLVLFVVLMS